MSNENSTFGGIFSKLGKLVFTDDYLNENAPPPDEKVMPTQTNGATTIVSANNANQASPAYSGTPKQEILAKVRNLVASMNKPGIDFLELWNAAEAMGSISDNTVQNAFVALKIASGNTLTKANVLSTGESYCAELKSALDNDVNEKIKSKNKLSEAKNNSRNSLSNEITELNNKIVEMQNVLKEKNLKLQNIDADFDPKLQEIDQKINNGKQAVDAVVAEMQQVLGIAARVIKE